MKKEFLIFITSLVLLNYSTSAQTAMKAYKAGFAFNISLPDYMNKTGGLNSSAAIQYKNTVKDLYGFVIYDTKDDLALVDMKFSSINEFYDEFMKDFVKDEEKRVVSKPITQKKGETNFLEADLTYYDKNAKLDIYYLIGIVETKNAYYKVLSWTSVENKDKFKADFQKILFSVTD